MGDTLHHESPEPHTFKKLSAETPAELGTTTNNIMEPNDKPDQPVKVGTTEKKRCQKCNKRLKLMPFECRCGAVTCSQHRMPEDHDCTFDYRTFGQEYLKKRNPTVAANKIKRI